MLSCTGKRSHRHTILHVSFSNSFGLASARPTPQGLSGAPENDTITVLKMMSARNVRESTNKPLTIIKQSELKHMIDESVRMVFAERRNRRLNEAVGRSFRMVLKEYLTRNR